DLLVQLTSTRFQGLLQRQALWVVGLELLRALVCLAAQRPCLLFSRGVAIRCLVAAEPAHAGLAQPLAARLWCRALVVGGREPRAERVRVRRGNLEPVIAERIVGSWFAVLVWVVFVRRMTHATSRMLIA